MKYEVEVLSEPKGSNPGGLCTVLDSNGAKLIDGYFKYVYGSRLSPKSPFRATHQPILEVMTSLIARDFGLITPDTYVLDNRDNEVVFKCDLKDHSGKKFYFLSRLQSNPTSDVIDKKLEDNNAVDSIYMNALLIGDYNRRQNQVYQEGSTSYVDLGCWRFACANDGFLKDRLRNFKPLLGKELKKGYKRLENFSIKAKNEKLINLKNIVESISEIGIPIFGEYMKVGVSDLLNEDEIKYIQGYLAQSFIKSKGKFCEAGLMVK